MKYLDKTFWQMSGIFLLIVLGTLVGVYYLRAYETGRALDAMSDSATVAK